MSQTFADQIRELLLKRPGLTDREITDVLKGHSAHPSQANQECNLLARQGRILRSKDEAGIWRNYIPSVRVAQRKAPAETLDQRLAQLSGIRVSHIATFTLVEAPFETDPDILITDSRYRDIDQIPMRRNGGIVGVFIRKGKTYVRRELEESMLVSSSQPLLDLLPDMCERSFRLVVQGPRIEGIVCISDSNKGGMRTLLFGLVSTYEDALTEYLKRHCDASWRSAIPDDVETIEKRFEKQKRAKVEIDLLDCASLRQKHRIVLAHLKLGSMPNWMGKIHTLRNALAHSYSLGSSQRALRGSILAAQKAREKAGVLWNAIEYPVAIERFSAE